MRLQNFISNLLSTSILRNQIGKKITDYSHYPIFHLRVQVLFGCNDSLSVIPLEIANHTMLMVHSYEPNNQRTVMCRILSYYGVYFLHMKE